MASLRQIRRRMKSVHSINAITKAMQMISTFRFKRAETRFSKIRAYLLELGGILSNLSASVTDLQHPLFSSVGGSASGGEKRVVKKKTLIVMTGDKGLCGAYNMNLIKAALLWKKQNSSFETSFIPVGKVGYESFRKKGLSMALFYPEKALADLALAKKMTEEIKNLYLSKKTDEVSLIYTRFKAGGTSAAVVEPILPLNHLIENRKDQSAPVDYIYEPGFEKVFFDLLNKYLEGKMYLSVLESLTSEYSARMMAMKQASENGEEVLFDLKLLKNKTRQAVITRELSEIVAGASILV